MNDWQEFAPTTTAMPTGQPHAVPSREPARAILGGANVDLRWFDEAVMEIMSAAEHPHRNPLAVVSANPDHVMHFGAGSRWGGTLEVADSIDWLTLLDGAPLRAKATQLTGQQWPRLAGSDLIHPLLDQAEKMSLRIGFLGGSEQTHHLLKEQFARHRPSLKVSGWWTPERSALTDRKSSQGLAREVAQAGTDMLVVGLGKPRQELWIAQYGALTGASVLLAFGAVVDFLAGRIQRAPQAVADAGMEWAWRLALEPRRLAKRYLVQGPEAYLRMSRHSSIGSAPAPHESAAPLNSFATAAELVSAAAAPASVPVRPPMGGPGATGGGPQPPIAFTPAGGLADVTVVMVTYNNAGDMDPLLASLRGETGSQTLKIVVADNGSQDGTLERLRAHRDVVVVPTGGNLGYAGGINVALKKAGPYGDVLVLNPDLRVLPGAIQALRHRMQVSNAGIVVPKLLDDDGSSYTSLRREPSLSKALGDAVFGRRLAGRPDWLSEIDYNAESYQYPHPIEWATGAALLISGKVVADLGGWDERYFLYSEETDYFRRARNKGHAIWFEPGASMTHSRGGSGASADLVALMAVNRVRYAQAHHSRGYAALVRAVGASGELARAHKPGNRRAFLALSGALPWRRLPQARPAGDDAAVLAHTPGQERSPAFPTGSVIIPAHNEAAVIARTLRPLAALAESGQIEVIVACNGCTDATAAIAGSFPGVRVLDVAEASKSAALNAGDNVASLWPRLYLDADIELTAAALAQLFEHLASFGALAARPAFRYETAGADPLVKAYYRARLRIPAMNEHLWGAGAYAVSAAGHARFPQFPAATADDAFVDSLFDASERTILPTDPVVVRVPLRTRELHKTLRRIYRGNQELAGSAPRSGGMAHVIHSISGPLTFADAGIYASLAVSGKLYKGKSLTKNGGWDRDDSSRTA